MGGWAGRLSVVWSCCSVCVRGRLSTCLPASLVSFCRLWLSLRLRLSLSLVLRVSVSVSESVSVSGLVRLSLSVHLGRSVVVIASS